MATPRIAWTQPNPKTVVFESKNAWKAEVKRIFKEVRKESTRAKNKPEENRNVFLTILESTGVPAVAGASSPKEDAIGLLKFAAEIEHALMVQYLYSAFSLKLGDAGGVGPWSKIMSVAVQEMGHLLSVQNLLILVAGNTELHFGRDAIRAGNPENPIPLVLERVSKAALTKYIAAEMPAVITDKTLSKRVENLIAEVGQIELHRVGALYAKLFWLFQLDDNPVPPMNLVPDARLGFQPGWHLKETDFADPGVLQQFQAGRTEWIKGSVNNFILESPTDSKSALELITDISEQGEGLDEKHDSHFFEFVELLDVLEANQLTVSPLPTVELPGSTTVEPVPVGSQYARLWSDLMDIRYNFLILDLWHGLATAVSSPARRVLIDLAYSNMRFISEISNLLLSYDKAEAPPSFNLAFEDLPSQDELRLARHNELLKRQAAITEKIKNNPEFQDCSSGECEILDFAGNICLLNLDQNDITRRTLMPPVNPIT